MTELNSILAGNNEGSGDTAGANAGQEQQHQQQQHDPAKAGEAGGQQGQAAQAGTGAADDADPEILDIGGGRRAVPYEALQAERGKRKKYTDQIASFEKQIADSNKRFEEREKFWDQRFNQLIGALQPKQQPQSGQQQQQEQQQPAPDFFEDPNAAIDAAIKRAINPVISTVRQTTEQTSRRFAESQHGADTVNSAYRAMEQSLQSNNPRAWGEYNRIMQSGDPWGELVNWHKGQAALAEFGNDPAAYRAKLEAEILEKHGLKPGQGAQAPAGGEQQQQQQAQQGQQQQKPPVMPSNLAGARNAGVRSGPAWAGPASLGDIFDRRNEAVTRG